jgi:hypothetical protein
VSRRQEKRRLRVDEPVTDEYRFAALLMAVQKRHRQAVLDVLASLSVEKCQAPGDTPSRKTKKAPTR